MRFQGLGVSPGRAMAPVRVMRETRISFDSDTASRPAGSLSDLHEALAKSKAGLQQVVSDAVKRVGAEHAAIFEAQLSMLDDSEWLDPIIDRVKVGEDPAYAVWTVSSELADDLQELDDPYLRERSADIRDLANRVVGHLRGDAAGKLDSSGEATATDEPVILIAHELTPSDTVGLDPEMVRGIITEVGARTSHAAILARQLGIPAVVSVPGLMEAAHGGTGAMLDGSSGEVHLDPSAEERASFEAVADRSWEIDPQPVQTTDGVHVAVYANAGSAEDVARAIAFGADGVGLFRTELLFIRTGAQLGEEEQYSAYSAAAQAAEGRPIVFRTLDIGGDKPLPGLSVPAEENPFLGLRGVRLSLAHQEIFEAQLRALARAAAEYPNVRIMIPMVSQLEELAHVREIATAVAAGVPLALGVMIEVPSAALLAREFAANADFLSVGSNDLTAYLMAADRNNEHVEHLYNELNPAVIRMLAHIAAAGSESSTPVSICGELAGEPRTLPLLVGLGLRNISVAPGLVPRLKAQIRELDTRLLAEPAEEALRARSASEMQILTAQLNSLTGAQG